MENKSGNKDDKTPAARETGSNLTGTALKGKPGHQRDIDPQKFEEAPKRTELPDGSIENTDALLGDVHPTRRNPKSQEQDNADQES